MMMMMIIIIMMMMMIIIIIIIVIIIIAFKGAFEIFYNLLTVPRTLKWPGRNRVQRATH